MNPGRGWYVNPRDESVAGPAERLAGEKVQQYLAHLAQLEESARRIVQGIDRADTARPIVEESVG
jgi:hypothetical protein